MLIASKYEEIYAPEVQDFVYITDKAYSKAEILECEYKMLKTLNFHNLMQKSFFRFGLFYSLHKKYYFLSF